MNTMYTGTITFMTAVKTRLYDPLGKTFTTVQHIINSNQSRQLETPNF